MLYTLLVLGFCVFQALCLKISVPEDVIQGAPTVVTWTRENKDPQSFELRLESKLFSGSPTKVNSQEVSGTVSITFQDLGSQTLVAPNPNPLFAFIPLGKSNKFTVKADASSTPPDSPPPSPPASPTSNPGGDPAQSPAASPDPTSPAATPPSSPTSADSPQTNTQSNNPNTANAAADGAASQTSQTSQSQSPAGDATTPSSPSGQLPPPSSSDNASSPTAVGPPVVNNDNQPSLGGLDGSQTQDSSSTPTQSLTNSNTPSGASSKNNSAVIAAAIAVPTVILLLAAAAVYFVRRDRGGSNRVSFHRDLMVREPGLSTSVGSTSFSMVTPAGDASNPSAAYPFATGYSSNTAPKPSDIEGGYGDAYGGMAEGEKY